MAVIQEHLETEVTYTCDVLVCGGGIGGIAAALAAARSGKRVILTERCFLLGGLATAGLVTVYLPLCDGYGHQVSFGLAEELLRLSVSLWHDGGRGYHDWIETPDAPKDENTYRYIVNFDPQLFAIVAERRLIAEGVKLLYGTTAVAATRRGDKLEAVIFENKSGRFAITAASFVDATGDADLAVFSDTPTALYGRGNLLAAWYYFNGSTGYDLTMLGEAEPPAWQTGGEKPLSVRRFGGIDGEEITDFTCLAHEAILRDMEKRRETHPEVHPLTVATVPQLRMTRRVVGAYTQDDTEMHTYFADSVGMVSDWRRRGPIYEVPFRTLYSAATKNLLFAGRITSVTDPMWDIMRVIPCCAVTGEAAGVAAAMGDDMTTLDVAALQAELIHRGVRLHEADLEGHKGATS